MPPKTSVLDTSACQEGAVHLSAQYRKHDALAEIHASIGELIARRDESLPGGGQ